MSQICCGLNDSYPFFRSCDIIRSREVLAKVLESAPRIHINRAAKSVFQLFTSSSPLLAESVRCTSSFSARVRETYVRQRIRETRDDIIRRRGKEMGE